MRDRRREGSEGRKRDERGKGGALRSELGVVSGIDALVAEGLADLIDAIETANDELLAYHQEKGSGGGGERERGGNNEKG